ncbi:triose-phosphate transporter family-domain-containing protein [Chytridium lagenaria]|nr:triose-phosphate transporter family-domain-containing protein [Chytridium lagenaria]
MLSSTLLWYATSLALSLYNKWMFGQAHKNFAFPLFTSSMHMLLQLVLSYVAVLMVWPKLKPKKYPPLKDYLTRVLPCGVATGMDIGLSNSSLHTKTITLSFYTMVKSGAPVFVLIFAFWFGLEKPTWKLTAIISIICLGVLLMVIHETNFSTSGYIQVQIATILSGFRWSITQILLERESIGMSNPFATSIFLAPVMGLSLLVFSIIIERTPGALVASNHFSGFWESLHTIGWILLGGLIAFVMVISEFKLISTTSVVTFSVAGIFKEIITITASSIVFKDTFTATNILGLIISLFGIALYNYVRITGMKETHAPPKRRKAEVPAETQAGGEAQRGLLQAAEEFFDVDIEDEDDETGGDRALYAARSGGVFGYNPVTTFISFRDVGGGDGTELDSFYPVGDLEEDGEQVEEAGLSKREALL